MRNLVMIAFIMGLANGCAHLNSPICEAKEMLYQCEQVCDGKVDSFEAQPELNKISCECHRRWDNK